MEPDMDRVSPDRAALEVAHIWLQTPTPIDDMLKDPSLKIILHAVARQHMKRRSRLDVKKLQANDHD
jgi:hypothetical protein